MERDTSKLKLGWTVAKLAGRRLVRAQVGAADEALGEALTDQLDHMKGLAMKLGQIVSYMDVPLPDVVQQRMSSLQQGVSGMDEAATLQALRAALGADALEQFERFDISPCAAASIGQVHRARHKGREVAVKLQYPQVARGFDEDLRAVGRIASLASLASAVDGQAIVRELAARLVEECDYLSESHSQAVFARHFAQDQALIIPEVISELCTHTSLVSSWHDGERYTSAADFAEQTRSDIAHALIRFSYGSMLSGCAIQADPHPGNFLFQSTGQVVCLDFGCVRQFEVEFVQNLRAMIVAIEQRDLVGFRTAVMALGMAPQPKKFDFEYFFSMMEHLHRPLLAEHFQFSAAYVKEGIAYNGPTNPNARSMNMPPAYVWVARLQWGLWSLLARLGARISCRDFIEELLSGPIVPMFTHHEGTP